MWKMKRELSFWTESRKHSYFLIAVQHPTLGTITTPYRTVWLHTFHSHV